MPEYQEMAMINVFENCSIDSRGRKERTVLKGLSQKTISK
jgi:hypothetical protein